MKIVALIFVLSLLFAMGFVVGCYFKEGQLKKKILNKENVIACFKEVDWRKQTFTCGEGTPLIETPDGVKHFYKVPPIDAAIEKLNALIDQSPDGK